MMEQKYHKTGTKTREKIMENPKMCPYLIRVNGRERYCRGTVADCEIRTWHPNKRSAEEHNAMFCCRNYHSCEMGLRQLRMESGGSGAEAFEVPFLQSERKQNAYKKEE